MLTLDEAILHAEEVAEELEKRVKPYQCEAINKKLYEVNKKEWNDCLECAEEHRQLAEWLKELKAYKEELPKEIKNAKVRQAEALEANVKNENYNSHLAEYIKGYLCGLSYTEGIIAKILEDVKVVEDGSDTK